MNIFDSTGNGFSEPQVISRRSEYPFWSEGDKFCRLVYDTVIVLETAYQPLALDTPHPTIAGAFLVEETPPANYEVGWVQFDRVYAVLGSGFTTYGAGNFEFPGLSQSIEGDDLGISLTVGNVTTASGRVKQFYVTGAFPSDAKFVFLSLTGVFSAQGTIPQTFSRRGISRIDTIPQNIYLQGGKRVIWILIAQNYINPRITVSVTSIKEVGAWARAPFNKTATSKTETNFYRASTIDDIPIVPKFAAFTAPAPPAFITKTETLTPTTNPTIAEYAAQMGTGEWIPIQDTIVKRWKGNIYRSDTTYVKAQ